MNTSSEIPLPRAWRALFGTELPPDPAALTALDPEHLRRAFRQQARRCHPDLAASMGVPEDTLTGRFQELQASYATLLEHLERGAETAARPSAAPPRPAWPKDESLSHSGMHWIGGVPGRPLQIGRYLYYTGRISKTRLREALQWQQSQRPPLGALAVDAGLLGQMELGQIMSSRRLGEPIGQTAVRLGMLSPEMRDWLVSRQRKQQRPLGSYFVLTGTLSEPELDQALAEHRAHNARVGARD